MKKNLFLMAMAIMALGFTACTSDAADSTHAWYDLQGRRIPDNTNTWKGIYLKNGQKIIK